MENKLTTHKKLVQDFIKENNLELLEQFTQKSVFVGSIKYYKVKTTKHYYLMSVSSVGVVIGYNDFDDIREELVIQNKDVARGLEQFKRFLESEF